MKKKIISIVHFSPNLTFSNSEVIKLDDRKFTRFNDSLQFWFFALGTKFMDKYSDEFDYEIWQPDININKKITKRYKNGIIYTLFPAVHKSVFENYRIRKRLYSSTLIQEIENQISQNNELLLLFRGTKEYLTNFIVNRFYKKISFVGHFTILISHNLNTKRLGNNILKVNYFKYRIVQPYKKFLKKVHNLVPATQNDIHSNHFFNDLNVYYRENCSSLGMDTNLWKSSPNKNIIKEKFGLDKSEKVFLISSRIVKEKQIKEIIVALSSFKAHPFRLFITGSTAKNKYFEEVNDLAHKLLDGKVRFTGFVSDEELRDLFKIADLFLSFSVQEGGPQTIYQAYLMEIPVIQSAVGIAGEVAQRYNISRLVDPKSIIELKEAFSDYFDGKIPQILDRETAVQYFGWSHIIDYWYQVFSTVFDSSKKNRSH